MLDAEVAPIHYARFPRRLLALCVDLALFVGGTLVFLIGVELVPIQTLWTILTALLVAALLLYEPLLVSITGGTVGHHALNLRVVRDDGRGNLRFLQALARMWIKGFLGVFSFFFMGLTRKHQALHDIATRSSVQIKDPEGAKVSHFAFERAVDPGEVDVSKQRRVAAILVWGLASFLVMTFATPQVISESCAVQDLCSEGEELALGAITLLWIVSLGAILVLGWRGQLPGARARALSLEE